MGYRAITVDDSGTVTRQPTPLRRTNTGGATRQNIPTAGSSPSATLSARGNAVAMSEAVRAVQHPESDTPQTRAYYRMAASESETLSAVRAAGGSNDFLFAGRAGNDEEDDNKRKLLHLEKENHWRKETEADFGQRDGDDLYPMPEILTGNVIENLRGDDSNSSGAVDLAEINRIVEWVYETLRHRPDIQPDPRQRGVPEFEILSDAVAAQTSSYTEYLMVMNSLLLGYASPGDYAVVATRAFGGPFLTDNIFQIGSTGLHADFNDRTDNQISFHIWAYIATTASPIASLSGIPLGSAANDYHELFQEPLSHVLVGLNLRQEPSATLASIEDYLAGIAALELGNQLRRGQITPQEFGRVFSENFGSEGGFYAVMRNNPDYSLAILPHVMRGTSAVQMIEETLAGLFVDAAPPPP